MQERDTFPHLLPTRPLKPYPGAPWPRAPGTPVTHWSHIALSQHTPLQHGHQAHTHRLGHIIPTPLTTYLWITAYTYKFQIPESVFCLQDESADESFQHVYMVNKCCIYHLPTFHEHAVLLEFFTFAVGGHIWWNSPYASKNRVKTHSKPVQCSHHTRHFFIWMSAPLSLAGGWRSHWPAGKGISSCDWLSSKGTPVQVYLSTCRKWLWHYWGPVQHEANTPRLG